MTKEDLDRARCSTPGCAEEHGPLYLKGMCHPYAGNQVAYEEGTLTISCHRCMKPIAQIAVKERRDA
jgi:hypothetical protein